MEAQVVYVTFLAEDFKKLTCILYVLFFYLWLHVDTQGNFVSYVLKMVAPLPTWVHEFFAWKQTHSPNLTPLLSTAEWLSMSKY